MNIKIRQHSDVFPHHILKRENSFKDYFRCVICGVIFTTTENLITFRKKYDNLYKEHSDLKLRQKILFRNR